MKRADFIFTIAMLAILVAIGYRTLFVETGTGDDTPKAINVMVRPVKVLACNEEGIILQGADMQIVTFDEGYSISQTMFKQAYKKGDIFIGELPPGIKVDELKVVEAKTTKRDVK